MSASSITDFQAEVARVFFALPEADSFLLAGGLALVAHGLTDRPTEDLDAFTCLADDVSKAVEAFTHAAAEKQWTVLVVQASDTFVRLSVTGRNELMIDFALDSPPDLPPTMSILGPTFAPMELAARKLLALFDRAMPRDFADLFRLVQHWERDELMRMAQTIDPGFDRAAFAMAMRQLDRYRNEDIPIDATQLPALRSYFRSWADALASAGTSGHQRAGIDS
ncbi:MAG: nucleotidyl transferase AbiEii/AbiGii toxin family protein [Actinomycetales bacterium]|nr:nucleotidyl transferase AbiEii/AbiGii toxin family protein [Actinomycetales bacterium]